MKNIWKKTILFFSLIGLIAMVTSCGGSDDPDPGTTTVVYAANPSSTNPAEVTADFKLTVDTSSGNVTVSGYDASWPMPSGFSNTTFSATEFADLGWDDATSITGDAATVSLVYTEVTSSARVKETETTYTYVFDKQ
ncbi:MULTISPECIES: hypothetical protein [Flammeovirga]|uniref:Uncharacterized protein n=1 Tax=Flammeovirga agarivorans TaxID=2726742 RepID=A0A7X8SQL6_9BACT|nr:MULTISPECIES: hypothetical protein [Flammeovirga]NLR94521.1 hypothetical protein [Flammeovirga agarivorans]